MDPILPPTPISPNIPLPAFSISQAAQAPAANFDPSSYPIPSSPDDGDDSDDGDLFPGTAHAIERSSNPALVPLPPSPKIKSALPHRRPKGWVSSYPDNASDINVSPGSAASDRVHSGPRGGSRSSRRVSARLPSGPTPLKIGGRTISGVMQYAIRPPSLSPPTSPPHPAPSPPSTNTDGLREDGSSESPPLSRADKLHMTPISTPLPTSVPGADVANDDVSDIDDIDDGGEGVDEEPYNLDEIRSSVVGLTDQANDEVWMSFVRQQLDTLFPDFFQPDTGDSDLHAPNESVGFGSLDGRTPASSGQGSDGWEMVQDGAHHRPMTMMRQGEYGSVPNVREEISGLREEIERLRGVVGGLASGLFDSGMIRGGEEDQVQRAGHVDRASRADQGDQANQADQVYQANYMDQADQVDQADQENQADQAGHMGQGGQARHVGQADQANYVERANQVGQADSTDQTVQPDQTDQADQADQKDRAHQADPEREDSRPRQILAKAGDAVEGRSVVSKEEFQHAEEPTVGLDDEERQDENAIDDELGLILPEDSDTGPMSPKSPDNGHNSVEKELPNGFFETASTSASMIRSLTHKLDAAADKEAPSDEEVFSAKNLARLQNRLLELIEKA